MGYNFLTDAELGKLIRMQAGLTDGQPEFMRLMNLYIEMEQDIKSGAPKSEDMVIESKPELEWVQTKRYDVIKDEAEANGVVVKALEFLHSALADDDFSGIPYSEIKVAAQKEDSVEPLSESDNSTLSYEEAQEEEIKRLYASGYSKREVSRMIVMPLKELDALMNTMKWYKTEGEAGPDGKVRRRRLNGMFTKYKGELTKKEITRIMKETGASEPCVRHYYNSVRVSHGNERLKG